MICQLTNCANEIIALGKRGPQPKFCSGKCKQANYRQTRTAKPVTPRVRSPRPEAKAAKLVTPRAEAGTSPEITKPVTVENKSTTQLLIEDCLRSYEQDAARFEGVDDFLFKMYTTLARQTRQTLDEYYEVIQ